MNSQEKLTVFENVLARVGLNGDVIGEYHKAISSLNGFKAYQEMQPPAAQMPMDNLMQNQGQTAPMSTEPIQSTTQGPIV